MKRKVIFVSLLICSCNLCACGRETMDNSPTLTEISSKDNEIQNTTFELAGEYIDENGDVNLIIEPKMMNFI